MRNRSRKRFSCAYQFLFASLSIAGCDRDAAVSTLRVIQVDTLVGPSYELLGYAADLATDRHGNLMIADYLNGVLHTRKKNGQMLTAGRKGGGPSELQAPMTVSSSDSGIWVGDAGKGLAILINSKGDISPRFRIAVGQPTQINSSGGFVHANTESDSEKLLVVGFGDTVRGRIADKVTRGPVFYDFEVMKREAANNRIPAILMNNVAGVWASDGGIWAIYTAGGRIERYGADLRKECEAKLEPPEVERIKAVFFERNRRQRDPSRFVTLAIVSDSYAFGDKLYLLYNVPDDDDAIIEVYGSQCTAVARLRLVGIKAAKAIAIGPTDSDVYVASSAEGTIVRAVVGSD